MKKKTTKPKPPVPTWKTVNTNRLSKGDVLFEMGDTRIIVSQLDLDYGLCYYEGDCPEVIAEIDTQILS